MYGRFEQECRVRGFILCILSRDVSPAPGKVIDQPVLGHVLERALFPRWPAWYHDRGDLLVLQVIYRSTCFTHVPIAEFVTLMICIDVEDVNEA